MERVSLLHRIWFEFAVPVFLERFVLAVLAAIFVGLILMNALNFDWPQRVSLGAALILFAYFVGHTVHRANRSPDPPPQSPVSKADTEIPRQDVPQSHLKEPSAAVAPTSKEKSVEPKKTKGGNQSVGNVTQSSSGPNSPNIATFGPNSPVTLHQGLAPWTLNAAQRQIVAETVRPFVRLWDGKYDVVTCSMGDPESQRMAEAFVAAFRAGGWDLPHGGYGQAISIPAPVGIAVEVPGVLGTDVLSPEITQFLNALSSGFARAGIISGPLNVGMTPGMKAGTFQVRIGRRPD